MELWVRTQNRFELAKINSVYAGYQEKDKDYVIMGQKHTGGARLGSYATKERALEVLDEIQNILKPRIITTGYECECKDSLVDKMSFNLEMIPTKTEIKELSCVIYEMPEE